MPWSSSDRRSRLPGNWKSICKRILKRDGYRCKAQTSTGRCPKPATDVDHIKAGDDHSDSNLQSLCREHHKAKTNREAHLAFMAQRREQRARIEREFGITEAHPGGGRRPPHRQPWQT